MATYYQIINTTSGANLGTYQAESESDALDLMAQDAGYEDYEQAQAVTGSDDERLLVREISFRLEAIEPDQLGSTGLREELDSIDGAELYRVEIAGEANTGYLLWSPADKRGGFACGADAVWTDAESAEDAVLRCLTDRVEN